MNGDDSREYYEILELRVDASPADIRKSYLFLKNLYSSESIVTIPLEDELSPDAKERLVEQIEEAYQRLAAATEQRRPAAPRRERRQSPEVDSDGGFTGPILRQIREQLDIGIQDLALATHIQTQYLENIEEENFAALPVYVYTRGYVANYAKHLGLDPQRVASDYMSRFSASRQGN
ncbi:MAG: helix-turn-helix domain-containing protein [Deltaproteobacteria bacterium]|jgi:hypothetical protein